MGYLVDKTRISPFVGTDKPDNFYPTYNAAKRAVSRYRKYDEHYWYSYPEHYKKNISKMVLLSFGKVFSTKNYFLPKGFKTIKIRRLKCEGLQDYVRANKGEQK